MDISLIHNKQGIPLGYVWDFIAILEAVQEISKDYKGSQGIQICLATGSLCVRTIMYNEELS